MQRVREAAASVEHGCRLAGGAGRLGGLVDGLATAREEKQDGGDHAGEGLGIDLRRVV